MRRKHFYLRRSGGDPKYVTEACSISPFILADSCTVELVFSELSHVSKWLRRFYKKKWSSLCSTPLSWIQWFFLYFPLDDDLGKSDSSSGSMDSFQVGPTFSRWVYCTSTIKSLFLVKDVMKKATSAANMWLTFRFNRYCLHTWTLSHSYAFVDQSDLTLNTDLLCVTMS